MRQTSALYKTLRDGLDSFYELQVVRGPIEYGLDRIRSCRITQALFDGDGPQIGGTQSAQCSLVLIEQTGNWPRMASFTVRLRLRDDAGQTSEWLPMGVYYTDERREDHFGNLTITAYDGMLLLEQSWTDKVETLPATWPITARAAATLLVEATGIQLDPRTVLDDTVRFIGLQTSSTAREIYADIAAAHGGNWVIGPTGLLRLVPLSTLDLGSCAIAGLAVAGLSVVGDGSIDYAQGATEIAYVGLAVSTLDTGEPLAAVTGVTLETEEGSEAVAGTDTGYRIHAPCNFSDSLAANLALSKLQGFVYRPFEAQGAYLDPAAEIGDMVVLDGLGYQIMGADWTLGADVTADLQAPLETEVDHEYTIPSESAKTLRKALQADAKQDALLRSYIDQTADAIRAGVRSEYATKIDLASVAESAITGETLHYLATDLSSGVTRQTAGWTTTVQTVSAQARYLWTYATYTYGDESTADTDPVITGVYGDTGSTGPQGPTGVGIQSVEPLHYLSTTDTAPAAPTARVTYTGTTATNTWTLGVPAVTAVSQYLFACDQVGYTDGSYRWTTPVRDNAVNDLAYRIQQAELKITPEAIISVVEDDFATKDGVQAATEELYASLGGGRNLVLDSLPDRTADLSGTSVTIHTYQLSDYGWAALQPGITAQISLEVKSAEAVRARCQLINAADVVFNITTIGETTTEWTRLSAEITIGTAGPPNRLAVFARTVGNSAPAEPITVYVRAVKLEISEEATAWSYAPEDYATVTEMQSSITQTADRIELEVSTKVGAQEVSSMISQSADSIRLKADKIAWSSTNSSMTEDGKLTCQEVKLEGPGYYSPGKVQTTLGTFTPIVNPGASGTVVYPLHGLKIEGVGNEYTPSGGDPVDVDETIMVVPGTTDLVNYTGDPSDYHTISEIAASGRLRIAAGVAGSLGLNYLDFNEWHGGLTHYGPGDTGYSMYLDNSQVSVGYKDSTGASALFYATGSLSYGGASATLNGYLTCIGGKSRAVKTKDYGTRLLYCYETPSPYFGDLGSGITDANGECYVSIDDIFSETSRTDIAYQVFLQAEGPGQLYVAEKTPTYFLVKGEPQLRFSWELKCKQLGFETERLDDFERREEALNNNGALYSEVLEHLDSLESIIKEQEELLS